MEIQPNEPRVVTLRAEQWQQVLTALNQAPYGIAAPLIKAIVDQCMEQTRWQSMRGSAELQAAMAPGNGDLQARSNEEQQS